MTPEQIERYSRHILLKEVGGQGQQKLLAARVLVVGAGGLGSPILMYLAAAGVGTIGIADNDHVDRSNLQRQTIYSNSDIGLQKTARAQQFIAELNPDINVIEHQFHVDKDNIGKTIADYDLIVEGVDNFETRFALNKACIKAGKPWISSAVGRFEGQITTFKPSDPASPCYRCLVPEIPPLDDQVNCAQEGILGAVTGVIGTLTAMEALKEILQIGDGLCQRLLIYDALTATSRTLSFPEDPDCPACSK